MNLSGERRGNVGRAELAVCALNQPKLPTRGNPSFAPLKDGGRICPKADRLSLNPFSIGIRAHETHFGQSVQKVKANVSQDAGLFVRQTQPYGIKRTITFRGCALRPREAAAGGAGLDCGANGDRARHPPRSVTASTRSAVRSHNISSRALPPWWVARLSMS